MNKNRTIKRTKEYLELFALQFEGFDLELCSMILDKPIDYLRGLMAEFGEFTPDEIKDLLANA